jgi:hypothetical protein
MRTPRLPAGAATIRRTARAGSPSFIPFQERPPSDEIQTPVSAATAMRSRLPGSTATSRMRPPRIDRLPSAVRLLQVRPRSVDRQRCLPAAYQAEPAARTRAFGSGGAMSDSAAGGASAAPGCHDSPLRLMNRRPEGSKA